MAKSVLHYPGKENLTDEHKKIVGAKGENQRVDAKVIQAALNLSQSATFKLEKNLTVDGSVGKRTIEAIELFQSTARVDASLSRYLVKRFAVILDTWHRIYSKRVGYFQSH